MRKSKGTELVKSEGGLWRWEVVNFSRDKGSIQRE